MTHGSYRFCVNDTATTEINTYRHTLSLHDALPIWRGLPALPAAAPGRCRSAGWHASSSRRSRSRRRCRLPPRSEEHTSELQSLMRILYAIFCLKKQTPHRTPCHSYKSQLNIPYHKPTSQHTNSMNKQKQTVT